MELAHSAIEIAGRVGIAEHSIVTQVGDSIFPHSHDRLEREFHFRVEFERRIGHLGDEQNVRCSRVLVCVAIVSRPQQCEVRLPATGPLSRRSGGPD